VAKRMNGDASRRTRVTKVGQDSYPGLLSRTDHQTWRECFAAAIAGTVSAHRSVPNPELVVRIAAKTADLALFECRRRRRTKHMWP
jgi:hypothetical protein